MRVYVYIYVYVYVKRLPLTLTYMYLIHPFPFLFFVSSTQRWRQGRLFVLVPNPIEIILKTYVTWCYNIIDFIY